MSSPNPFGPFDFEQLRKMLEAMGLGNPEELDLEQLMAQVQRLQQAGGGAMFGVTNADRDPDAAWRTTLTAAKQLAAESGADPELRPEERNAVGDAERLAQSWLTPRTSFPETGRPAKAVTRAAWLDATSDGWRSLIDPIIDGLAEALKRGTAEGVGQSDPMAQMLEPMMRTSASIIYRDRLKRELARVAGDILTGTEMGFNLLGNADVMIIPANVAQFTRDLDANERDVTLYLLLREAARQRLFHHVGWLSPQLRALLGHYSREITIDFDAIASQFRPENMDMENLSIEDIVAVGEKVRGSFFDPARTPAQVEILDRLEVLLALVEGWVDHIVAQATEGWMPNAPQIEEIIHRRRASATPVVSVFSELLGLDLTPRMVRDARNLWAAVEHHRGAEERDAVWRHPDLLPTAADMSDPLRFAAGTSGEASESEDEMDAELRRLLEGPDN